MKFLVTGAGGFIGSHLVEKCLEMGHEVRAFVRYNSNSSRGWLEYSALQNHVETFFGDVRDFDSVMRAMQGCDRVFHLAALIGIPYSYDSPLAYIKTNIEGTYNILQAARELSLQEIILTSTSETYGTAQYVPINESHPLVGQSPYSASKIGCDQMGISFYHSFGLPLKIVRPFNTYGPRQSPRAIIPAVIIQLLKKKREIELGNLDPTRDLTFVKDTVNGFLAVSDSKELLGQITNIGMGEEISIRDLVHLIASVMGVEVTIKKDERRIRPADSEVERLMCDNTKITSKTRWEPKYNLRTGLAETVAWFTENFNRYDDRYHV